MSYNPQAPEAQVYSNSDDDGATGARSSKVATTLGEVALILFEHHYPLVAIPPKGFEYGNGKVAGGKGPIEPGWQRYADAQTAGDVQRMAARNPDWGVGIVTGAVVGIDIDVLDPQASGDILELAGTTLGAGLPRIGQSPKVMLVYPTCRSPRSGPDFKRPGEQQQHHIEVLGKGQQLVAFARHPDTGRPYQWGERSPINTAAGNLPSITEAQARAFVAEAEGVLIHHGFQRVGSAASNKKREIRGKSILYEEVLPANKRVPIFAQVVSTVNAAACAGWVNIDEIDEASRHYPTGRGYDWWRDNWLFPISDAIALAPEHEQRLREIFERENRRTADPEKVAKKGESAFFEQALELLDYEVRRRRSG